MKDLKTYLETYCPDIIAKNEYYWEQAVDFFNNEVPQKYIELHENEELLSNDFIFETLKSHDVEKLKACLKKHWDDIEFEDYAGDKNKSFYLVLGDSLKLYDFYRDTPLKDHADYDNLEKFENILSFFNYYISYHKWANNHHIFFIEPRYSDDVTNEIFNNHYYLYHFTDKHTAELILKSGLRCKKSNYREFPERIFIYASKNKIDISNDKTKEFINKVIHHRNVSKYGLAVLNIKNNNKFKLYKDTAMTEPEAVFAYENIPAEYIKEIKNEKP